MDPLETAIRELRTILATDPATPRWRGIVRMRLAEINEALAIPSARQGEAWLAAQAHLCHRQRIQLQARVSVLAAGVFDRLDTDAAMHQVRRILGDLEHHVQRCHDLVYDSVSLELGGSE